MKPDYETRVLIRENSKQELAERLLNSRKLLEAEKAIRLSSDEKAVQFEGAVHELENTLARTREEAADLRGYCRRVVDEATLKVPPGKVTISGENRDKTIRAEIPTGVATPINDIMRLFDI